jgi:hypothetical protein
MNANKEIFYVLAHVRICGFYSIKNFNFRNFLENFHELFEQPLQKI